jgi:hypothetical protein
MNKIKVFILLVVALLPILIVNSCKEAGASATTVTLKWTATGDDSTSGAASQYDIRYSTVAITEITWTSATQVIGEPIPKIAGSQETFTVTGLTPSTTYYFAIKAADEVPNWSDLSNVVSITTIDGTRPSAITNLQTQQ